MCWVAKLIASAAVIVRPQWWSKRRPITKSSYWLKRAAVSGSVALGPGLVIFRPSLAAARHRPRGPVDRGPDRPAGRHASRWIGALSMRQDLGEGVLLGPNCRSAAAV